MPTDREGRALRFEKQFRDDSLVMRPLISLPRIAPFTARRRAMAMAKPITVFLADWSSDTLSTRSLDRPPIRMPCASKAAPSCAGENHAPRLRQMA